MVFSQGIALNQYILHVQADQLKKMCEFQRWAFGAKQLFIIAQCNNKEKKTNQVFYMFFCNL
ncbi:hypothetical protein L21SP5_01726 [Salinivirga cyanobacteriivorans]|uniref:Uncharacterized protein n=1 Tax=Salinivirga cyanobacteriivorans TaxID=1307839 RepID=A0A0S2HZ82_9BACT|nr:hypothetical protein L21SP5_01726 [Salinivirga cyanobacteriivorans]